MHTEENMGNGITGQQERATPRFMEIVRGINIWQALVVLFLVLMAVFLVVRADDEYRWSDWGFGDAQTMLSLRQWDEAGWFRNYFLFLPQGYAGAVRMLDEPELRQHAHGTCPGSSPRVGPRLWYTHYPAGYLVPYAAAFKVGFREIFHARVLSILFSVAALILMYSVFARISSPAVSFIAVLFYATSKPFLGFADTIANQPLDDMLRFGFMLSVVLSTRAPADVDRRRWTIAAWAMEWVLSLSSFDSVFFLYSWLICWDLLDRKGFRWKRYLLFSLAPLSAHGLQFLQNVWYLGFRDAVTDIVDAFLLKHGSNAEYNSGMSRMNVLIQAVAGMMITLFSSLKVFAGISGGYAAYLSFLKQRDDMLPSFGLLAALFLSGLAFIFVLPNAAKMPYEGRQMLPFASLLVGGTVMSFFVVFRRSLYGLWPQGIRLGRIRGYVSIPYMFVSIVLTVVIVWAVIMTDRTPAYSKEMILEISDTSFAQELNLSLKSKYEPVIFDLGAFQIFWDPRYVPGYPQILPITEFYAGSRPILCFDTPELMAKDIALLLRKSPYKFSPIITAADPEAVQAVLEQLKATVPMTATGPVGIRAQDRFVLDLTDYIDWDKLLTK
ncbi:MAG: hypothetical protein FIA94_07795 [Nitrospirae bacterium]|nr:hypothetical protein [Nitrospirota bacterium]